MDIQALEKLANRRKRIRTWKNYHSAMDRLGAARLAFKVAASELADAEVAANEAFDAYHVAWK